jgi:uncharacterized protein with HEPN domain
MPFSPSEPGRTACADIIANAERAARFVARFTLGTVEADERTHFAAVRCLEIVLQASRRLSAETKAQYPAVPWRQIADAGNVDRHSYHRVTLDIVWLTVHHELPVRAAACRAELDCAPDS